VNNPSNQKRVCFMVPTFPPHFDFVRNLIKSYQALLSSQADFYLVFTTEEEEEQFGQFNTSIVLPAELRIFDNKGIINIKKFYALTVLQDQYDYIICLDSEALFIKKIDLLTLCETHFAEKRLLGNTAQNDILPIVNQCLSHFSEALNRSALKLPLYLWFNNLCIYKSALLPDFFQKTGVLDKIKQLSFFDFDYYIFMNYLVLYQDFSVVDMEIEADWSACESHKKWELHFKSKKYRSSHILSRIYLCHSNVLPIYENPNLFLSIHVERSVSIEELSRETGFRKKFKSFRQRLKKRVKNLFAIDQSKNR
jgi:hypothetical protein